MAKPDKAELKKQGALLKEIIAQGRKKTLNFALLQGKDQMHLITHLKKNPAMLRKEAKKAGGGPKGITGTFNVEGKNLIFSVEEEPPGPFPKITKKHFMTRGIAIRVTFKLPNGMVVDDGEPAEEGDAPEAAPAKPIPAIDENPGSAKTAAPVQSEPEADEGLGASIMGMFSNLQDEVSKSLNEVGDDIRSGYDELTDKFNNSFIGKKFDEAAKNLEQLEKFHEKHIKPYVDKAKDYLEEINIRADATDRMEKLDLNDAQSAQLSDLAVNSPKLFEAALKTLAKMDGKFGDLDATPSGILALQKQADAAKKLAKAAGDKLMDEMEAYAKARDKEEASQKKLEEAAKKAKSLEAALIKLRQSLPKDVSEMSEVQKKTLSKVLLALKSSKTTLLVAKTQWAQDQSAFKLTKIAYDAADEADTQATKARDKQEKIAQAAVTKKKMLDSMAVGALSPNSKDPLDENEVLQILSAIDASAKFGSDALDLLESTKDKSNIAKGAGMLAKGMSDEFKDKDGNPYGDEKTREDYAVNALTLGNAMGGDYFDRMNAFVEKGGMNETPKLPFGYGSEKERDQKRAKFVSGAMLDSNGKIDTKSTTAQGALDEINFHPDAIYPATPGMNMHFADMVKTMEDPAHKAKMQTVLDGITAKPSEKTGRDLVAQSTGKAPGDVDDDDIKAAVMSAMFTPLNQGPVGSCFATGPARGLRDKDPAKAMAGMAEIASKGTFTTAQGVPIKAVRTSLGTTEADKKKNKLPEDDNPLMRSWEYSIATAGAMLADSDEEETLDQQLWATDSQSAPNGDNLHALKNLTGMKDWKNVKKRLKKEIHNQLDFRYNATSKIKDSADGSSTRGNFEINNNGKHPPTGPITTKADFIAVISALAIEAAKAKSDPALSQLIIDHCSSQKFIDSVCLWTKGKAGKKDDIRLPWQIGGGGYEAPMIKVLEGGERETKDILDDNPKAGKPGHLDKGDRTKKVVSKLLENYMKQGADVEMTNISTGGIHAFGGLPNHPSLDVLKEGSDPAAAMEKHMLKPGREMAAKEMDTRTVTMLFDRQVTALGTLRMPEGVLKDDEKGQELLAEARAKRPDKEMKPKELKALVDEIAKPINAYQTKANADAWKAKETAKGKAPDIKAYEKKLKAYQKYAKRKTEESFDNNIINTLEPPEFVIADTNWGDGEGHTFFVIIPDPVTGDPKMFQREEPSGKLSAMSEKWTNTNWQVTD